MELGLKFENHEIQEWVFEVLGNKITDITLIVQTPWSSVLRINTGNEFVYLKHTPKLIALEASIIKILHEQFNASVPTIIAHNTELNCFLMKDSGNSLREILYKKFDTDLLCKSIEQFTSLQLAVADNVDTLFNIGVPDWRLNKLPDLYQDVILQQDLLIADGLSKLEISELEKLLPKITNLCNQLSNYPMDCPIKPTIVQPDFSDNNTLIDKKSHKITTIDLGEISISHPFFSLFNCLQQVKKHYALTEEDNNYLRIKDACFKNYMDFEFKQNFLDAIAIAQILWIIYGILAQYRLILACGADNILRFQPGRLSTSFRELIHLCNVN